MAEKLDNDVLDMGGLWKITYGYVDERLGTDASLHAVPPGFPITTNTYQIKFDKGVPGNNGGFKYNGGIPDTPITYEAETYYNKKGVQLLHMVSRLDRTIELHCGAHWPFYSDDPKGVHIVGSWINCGGGFQGREPGFPYHSRFVMVKLRSLPNK